ncbi:MAG: hypothetical protein WCK48_02235 [bacterium]
MKSGESIFNLNATQEEIDSQTPAIEKMEAGSVKEAGAEIRANTVEAIKNASKKFSGLGSKLFGGLKKMMVKGKEVGIDTLDIALGAGAKGYHIAGNVTERLAGGVTNGPDWLFDKAGEDLEIIAERTGKLKDTVVEKAKEVGIATMERSSEIAGSVQSGVESGVDWTFVKFGQGEEWVDKKYGQLEGWAGEKATQIQEKAKSIRENLSDRIDSTVKWKKSMVEQYRESRKNREIEKLERKIDELDAKKLEVRAKLDEIKGISGLSRALEDARA